MKLLNDLEIGEAKKHHKDNHQHKHEEHKHEEHKHEEHKHEDHHDHDHDEEDHDEHNHEDHKNKSKYLNKPLIKRSVPKIINGPSNDKKMPCHTQDFYLQNFASKGHFDMEKLNHLCPVLLEQIISKACITSNNLNNEIIHNETVTDKPSNFECKIIIINIHKHVFNFTFHSF